MGIADKFELMIIEFETVALSIKAVKNIAILKISWNILHLWNTNEDP